MTGPTRTRSLLRALRRSKGSGVFDYLALVLSALVHPDLFRSGATLEEGRRGLPGDELVPHPMWQATRAITIEAPIDDVSPWVAQMGYGRGGWYGWNPLEGADTGVDRLLAVEEPSEGDVWLDGPGCDETKGAWVVKIVDKPRTLVLYTMRDPVNGRELQSGTSQRPWIQSGWSFHLLPTGTDSTRLLVRTRVLVRPRWALLPLKFMGGGDTVMQRRLLIGIKMRSEGGSSTRMISRLPQDLIRAMHRTGTSEVEMLAQIPDLGIALRAQGGSLDVACDSPGRGVVPSDAGPTAHGHGSRVRFAV